MFSLKSPVEPKKLANISGNDTSTNEETVVPMFGGVAKLPLTWVTPLYNLRSENVEQEGKKGVGGGGTQKKWFASIAGIACYCPDDAPVDALLYVLVNDEVAFTGPLGRTGGTHHASFTVDTFCQEAWIRWGTKDHPIDETLILTRRAALPDSGAFPSFDPRIKGTWPRFNANGDPVDTSEPIDETFPIAGVRDPRAGHYDLHPAYRNQCMFEFKDFFLGSSPNMPNVVVIIARGCKFFDGTRYEADEAGVNPIPFLYELMTDDLAGAGVLEESLDQTSFEATATALSDDGLLIAPVKTSPTSLRSFVADYLQYFDGWVRRNGSLLEIGRFTHGDIDDSGLLTLGSDDLVGEPSIAPTTLDDTLNHFEARFTNKDKWYEEDGQSYRDLANFLTVREKREKRFSVPFILTDELAMRFVTEAGRMLAKLGGGSGSATFLRPSVADLLVGDRFKLNSASFGLTMLMRVLGVELPAANENVTKLTLSVEQADWKHLFLQPPAPKDPDFRIDVAPIQAARILELPAGLKTSAPTITQLAVLALRPDDYIIGFRVFSSLDDIDYDQLGDNETAFAVKGKIVSEDYIAGTAVVDEAVGMVVQLYGPDLESIVSQSNQQRDDLRLLAFVENEIMSVGQVTPIDAETVRIYMRRAAFETVQAAHAIDTVVWFLLRADVVPIENANFIAGETVHFKLQPFTRTEAIDLADIDPIDFTLPTVPSALLAPFAMKVKRTYRTGPVLGIFEAHVDFTWDYDLDQDVVSFDMAWRAGGIAGLTGDWSYLNVAAAGVTIYDSQGVAQSKRQENDLVVGTSNLNYEIRVRAIDSAGIPSDWSDALSRRTVASSTTDPTTLEFTSKADLESYDVTGLTVGRVAFVTINNSTQLRQLQTGAPSSSTDWSVLAQSGMRWRKTGGT